MYIYIYIYIYTYIYIYYGGLSVGKARQNYWNRSSFYGFFDHVGFFGGAAGCWEGFACWENCWENGRFVAIEQSEYEGEWI